MYFSECIFALFNLAGLKGLFYINHYLMIKLNADIYCRSPLHISQSTNFVVDFVLIVNER